jgi:hypothetical protein
MYRLLSPVFTYALYIQCAYNVHTMCIQCAYNVHTMCIHTYIHTYIHTHTHTHTHSLSLPLSYMHTLPHHTLPHTGNELGCGGHAALLPYPPLQPLLRGAGAGHVHPLDTERTTAASCSMEQGMTLDFLFRCCPLTLHSEHTHKIYTVHDTTDKPTR